MQARQEAAPAFPEPSDDALFDFNAPPGFDAPPAAPPPPARPAAQARAVPQPAPEPSDDALFDFNAPPGFDAPPPAEAPAPAAGGDPLLDFFGAPPDAAPPAAPARPAPVAAPAPAPVAKGCRECGKPLVDPFDQALGACEDCRHRAQSEPQPAQEAAPSVEVIDLPPMDSSMSDAGRAPGAGYPMPEAARSIPAAPPLPPEPRSAARAAAARTGVAVSASSGRSKGPLIAVVVVLLLAGAGGAAYFLSPDVKTLVEKPLAAAGSGSGSGSGSAPRKSDSAEPLPPAVAAVLPRWQLLFVDGDGKEGDSQRLLEEGQAQLAKDQRFAYARAAELFQRALLADPRSDAAIGGYVQALALGRGSMMDETSFQEARSLIEAAEQRSPGNADLLVAHANLLLANPEEPGNLEQARKIAEGVLADTKEGTGAQKAEAHLVMGRTFMASSRELAIEHFESALAISSDLERVHYYRALLDESSGDYSAAIGRLQKRLEQDPEHWETISTLVRIYLEVGEPQLARQLYETRLKAAPNDFQALLASAVMRYQAEGSLQAALRALRGMLDKRDQYDQRQVAELLLHLVITERLANNLEASAKAGREALQLEKNNPAVHLQLFFVSLARKDAAEAASHLATLKGHLGEPALEKILEGRLRLLERKPAEAMTLFTEAAQLDPRHTDALLLAGVAAAQDGRRDEAFRVLAQALLGDPHRVAPRPVLTSFYQRPGELIQGLDGSIAGIARGDDDLLPFLYEGLLRYHQGEGAAAEKMFKKVSDVDASNAQASSFRALIALARKDRKSMDDAKGHAARAVAGGRQVALAHYVQGLVLANSKQVEPARKSLREAVALAPKLYAAEVKLGELEAPSSPGPVRERLVRLLGIDPSYLPAKRVLYLIDKDKRG
ncbi:tetratricopeptide repeat protein [Cystobacter fuscus]|nr:tetratricopeptide repeat protein [Cystobacter fuscus]